MFGHHGRILTVNLGTGKIVATDYDDVFARTYLGGNGFAAKLIRDGVAPDADPLGEENALVFTVGPVTDTPVWGTSRGHLAGISPLTGLFADSNFGGDFAVAQKRTGFDAIYVTGRSDTPVYLRVTESGARILDASDIWGMTTEAACTALQQREGKGAVAISIGPAGENRVLFANVVCGGARTGAAGRGGLGAVMGSKNLKALVALGDRRTRIKRPERLRESLRERRAEMLSNAEKLSKWGTPFLVDMINGYGLMCTHNAAKETFEFAADINAEVLKTGYVVKNTACRGCPVACGKSVRVPAGEYAGRVVKMPEYETIYAVGSMLDIRDMTAIVNANGACDLLGLDTISMGVTLAFVAECLEKGIVRDSDIGGAIDFADGDGMVEAVKATAARSGIGELLALGSRRLAERFGPESRKYLYGVKGLEIAGHSARGLRPMALGYATSTRGGSHHDTRPQYRDAAQDVGFDGQSEYSVMSQNFTAVGDSLIMCRFVQERALGSGNNEATAGLLGDVTGWDIDAVELERIGERIYNIERLINVSRGVRRKDDTIPWRTMHEPIPDGPAKGRRCPPETLDAMLDEYYRLRGWTRDGVPTAEKLEELGLSESTGDDAP